MLLNINALVPILEHWKVLTNLLKMWQYWIKRVWSSINVTKGFKNYKFSIWSCRTYITLKEITSNKLHNYNLSFTLETLSKLTTSCNTILKKMISYQSFLIVCQGFFCFFNQGSFPPLILHIANKCWEREKAKTG